MITTPEKWSRRGYDRRCKHPSKNGKPKPFKAWNCGICRAQLIKEIQEEVRSEMEGCDGQ